MVRAIQPVAHLRTAGRELTSDLVMDRGELRLAAKSVRHSALVGDDDEEKSKLRERAHRRDGTGHQMHVFPLMKMADFLDQHTVAIEKNCGPAGHVGCVTSIEA